MKNSITQLFDLSNKVAIVTGGVMGIGKGIALRLAEAGAKILIADIVTPKSAEKTLKEIRAINSNVEYIQVDLTDSSNAKKVIDFALEQYNDIDILINNAGIFISSPVLELTESLWDKTQNLNLKTAAFLSKQAIEVMVKKKHQGRIINISSVDGIRPTGQLCHYDASKGGLRMLTKAFAKEVGSYGITVNDIAPGGVDTPGVHKMSGENPSEESLKIIDEQLKQFAKTLPIQRMGQPEDIANATLFLASDAASYITGSTIVVDGGLLLN